MDKKTTDIVAYLTVIGLIIAFVAGDKEASKFHLNQSLVIWLVSTVVGLVVGWVPLIGWLVSFVVGIFCTVCWFIGIISAIQGTEKSVPLIGQIKLLKYGQKHTNQNMTNPFPGARLLALGSGSSVETTNCFLYGKRELMGRHADQLQIHRCGGRKLFPAALI